MSRAIWSPRFLRERLNPDGGFQDRAGASDLYYTVFGLDALIALQEELPVDATAAYLDGFGDGAGLDFVHLACLARGVGGAAPPARPALVDRMLARIEACRSDDGGYATTPAAPHGSAYGAFLALGRVSGSRPRSCRMPTASLASLRRLRAADGSYGNHPGLPSGITTATAAAVARPAAPRTRRPIATPACGCSIAATRAADSSPRAPRRFRISSRRRRRSTRLSALHVPIAGLREPCLDFVDSLWTNRGGFFGTWADDAVDCEYTYYALLALGHLSLEPS